MINQFSCDTEHTDDSASILKKSIKTTIGLQIASWPFIIANCFIIGYIVTNIGKSREVEDNAQHLSEEDMI